MLFHPDDGNSRAIEKRVDELPLLHTNSNWSDAYATILILLENLEQFLSRHCDSPSFVPGIFLHIA